MSHFTLAGRTALVTGASSGIGLALARELARHGARLVITARRSERLERLADELAAGGRPRPVVVPGDLGLPGGPAAVFTAARAAAGPIQLLVNNAGFGRLGAAHQVGIESVRGILRVNVEALVHLTLLALPEMVERREGAILNVASTAAFVPLPYMATYSASKAFVVSFSEAVHAEVKRHGVRVVCLCPGRAATEFAAVAGYGEAGRASGGASGGGGGGMAPEAVAREGIAALEAGAPLRSAGAANRAMVGLLRLVPRRAALALAERLMRPKHSRDSRDRISP
jgi:short-subunit dehydrogenase